MVIHEYEGDILARVQATPRIMTYVIKAADVGKFQVDCLVNEQRVVVPLAGVLGRVLPGDVGKIMVSTPGDGWHVESEQQFNQRLASMK